MRYDSKIMAIALAICLLGCTGPTVPDAKSTTGRAPTVAEVPNDDETVRGEEDPAVVTLDLGAQLKEHRVAKGEDLPGNVIVPSTNLNAVPVTTALQAVLAGTDVSLSWQGAEFDDRLVSVTNLSGALPRVVEKICTSAKVFCNYNGGLLELKETDTFIIELPTMPTKASSSGSATNTMADAIGDLAGNEVRIDQQGGKLIYTTDVEGQQRVREYLSQLRNGRPLVVMQLYIWEVTLNKNSAAGINWKSFSFDKIGGKLQNALLAGSTGFAAMKSPGVSLGAKFSGHVDAEAVLEFLSTQGQVQTISNPQLTFVSGSNAEFKVGGNKRYISQVGQLTSGSVDGSNASNAGVGTNTVSTSSIDTGLTVSVGGVLESGVISAVLDLEMKDIIGLNPTKSNESGVTIDLPEISERKVSTSLRVRPGDNLVLAGLVTSRDTNSREGIPLPFGGSIPSSNTDEYRNTELVILVKPSVVLFSDKGSITESKKTEKAKEQQALPPMNAVVIDKNGAKTFSMPDVDQPISLQTTEASGASMVAQSANAEAIYNDPTALSMQRVPITPGEDGAPVDRRLLQRGFSHAFDELLASPSNNSGGGFK